MNAERATNGASAPHPLDLERSAYTYIERENPAIVALYEKHVASRTSSPRVLDIGCGCAANDRAFRARTRGATIVGIEPNARAAELARQSCDEVYEGTLQEWIAKAPRAPFDVVVLSDVLEHIADPVEFLRSVASCAPLRGASWIISVPNYGVWYNRVRSLFGVQDYAWSGLWDRTHLRFFTRRSIAQLLDYCGFDVVDVTCTPSIVQSAAPLLRKAFEKDVAHGDHLALADSRAYGLYQKAVEPIEARVCGIWPSLLGFQIVHVAKLR